MNKDVTVTLYTRQNCSLCDEAKKVILRVIHTAGLPFVFEEIDIDSDPVLKREFNDEVPVVFVGSRKAFKYRVDPNELERRLRSALKRTWTPAWMRKLKGAPEHE